MGEESDQTRDNILTETIGPTCPFIAWRYFKVFTKISILHLTRHIEIVRIFPTPELSNVLS